LTIKPAVLGAIKIASNRILAGDSMNGYVALSGSVSSSTQVSLTSNNAAVTVPPTATVPANQQTSPLFTVKSSLVNQQQTVTLSATLNGLTRTATLTVDVAAFGISGGPTVVSGHNTTGTVTLPAPAPSGGYNIGLFTQASSIAVPKSVTIPAGQTSATFPITVYGVNAPGRQAFFGIAHSLSRVAYVNITPAPLLKVQLVATTLHAGQSTTGRAYLNGMNGSHPQVVTLSSDNPNVSVPASVTIPHDGRLSFTFAVNTLKGSPGSATISATLTGVTKTTVLTLN